MKKLTLSAEPEVIELARQVAKEQGTSVSRLFSNFIRVIAARKKKPPKIGPLTRKASGLAKLPPRKTAEEVYEEALLEKYGLGP